MKTNELKKGDRVRLTNGWDAIVEDNKKGNTRVCTVFGYFTEMGSVYSHDIKFKYEYDGSLSYIELTPAQIELKNLVRF
jgi:hypothetical protein